VIWFAVALVAPIAVLFYLAEWDCGEDEWKEP
jgi:hypothetical protein